MGLAPKLPRRPRLSSRLLRKLLPKSQTPSSSNPQTPATQTKEESPPILALPNELLSMIAEELPTNALSRLASVDTRFQAISTPILHRHAMMEYEGIASLHWAVVKGHVPLVSLLLDKGCDIEPRDKDHRTPLHIAVINDNFQLVRLLLSRGADLQVRGKGGLTAIACAARFASVGMCKLLLDAGADAHWRGETGETLLHLPMRRDEVDDNVMDILTLILSKGVNTAIGDHEYGVTPLHAAACKREVNMMRILLDAGADIDARDANGFTPIFTPFEPSGEQFVNLPKKGNRRVMELLIERGADLNVQCNDGYALLHQASTTRNGMVDGTNTSPARYVRKLIANGAEVRAQDTAGRTPLHIAAMEGDRYTIKALLSCGAKLDGPSADGTTPIEYAARAGMVKNVLHFMHLGAKTEFEAGSRSSVLHYAAHDGWAVDFVHALISKGASLTAKNADGDTPLMVAERLGRKALSEVLRDAEEGKHRWSFSVRVGKLTLFEIGGVLYQKKFISRSKKKRRL